MDAPLEVVATPVGLTLVHDDDVVIEAERAGLDLEVPPGVSVVDATEAAIGYPGFAHHPFPTCFVCGPERAEGDGLRIFSGPVPARGDDVWAAPWRPDRSTGRDGTVDPRIVWAALDCPSYFAVGHGDVLAVLGRITASLHAPVEIGGSYVLLSWPLSRDGRKLTAGSAVLDDDGHVLARARATWIVLASG